MDIITTKFIQSLKNEINNDLKINLEYENHKDFTKISSELIYKYRYHEN